MTKIIKFLSIIILLLVIVALVIGMFNPMGSRDKVISGVVDGYLSDNISGYESLPDNAPTFEERKFDNPLLNDDQEKTLYNLGVDTSKLPTEITDNMQKCFIDILGQDRANELVAGAVPSSVEIYKTKECLGE